MQLAQLGNLLLPGNGSFAANTSAANIRLFVQTAQQGYHS
jgi:hypothetical protein